MKSTEVLNPRRSDFDRQTRRLVHTHKLTTYYIHCGDTRCIINALNCVCYGKNQTSRSRETQKKSSLGVIFT